MNERSEKPTARKRQKAQEEGRLVRSREVTNTAALIAAAAYFWNAWPSLLQKFSQLLKLSIYWGSSHDGDALIRSTVAECASSIAILICVVSGAAFAAMYVQHPTVVFAGSNLLRLNRLNVAANIKALLHVDNVLKLSKAVATGSAIACVAVSSMPQVLHGSLRPSQMSRLAEGFQSTVWRSLMVLACSAAVDYVFERRKHEASLRMTKQEVRQEARESESNPQIKGKLRQLQRRARRGQNLKHVKRATVIVVNPTHVSVALEYRPQASSVPTVIAKGVDATALRIRELANWSEIPIVESRQLARELYRTCDPGDRIPQKLYAAVAEVLALVYRADAQLRSKARTAER